MKLTIKKKIVLLNTATASIALVFGSILVLRSWEQSRELSSFSKVSDFLIQMVTVGDTLKKERFGVWIASPEHTWASSVEEGRAQFRELIEDTNTEIQSLQKIGSEMNPADYSEGFRSFLKEGMKIEDKLSDIRDEVLVRRGEIYPVTLRYNEVAKNLFSLITQIATETNDAELTRKIIVSDLSLQAIFRIEEHAGRLNHVLRTGEATEQSSTMTNAFLEEITPILTRIETLLGPEGKKQYQDKIRNELFEEIIETTRYALAAGTTYGGATHSYEKSRIENTKLATAEYLEHAPKFRDFLLTDIASYTNERIAKANASMFSSLAFITITMVASALGGWYIVRRIERSIKSSAEKLENSSNTGRTLSEFVSKAANDLANGCSQQAASIEEIHSTVSQIEDLSKSNTEQISKVRSGATQSNRAAKAGTDSMVKMRTAMTRIHDNSNDIVKIAKEIEEIAFQTNILALNAAVEAARAGEAGAGFAIVADEVRSLAQKSAVSAHSTREKIENAKLSVAEGSNLSEEVASHLEEILEQTESFSCAMAEVETTSRQRSNAIEEIAKAIADIDDVTQRNAASAEESAGAATSLESQSGQVLTQIHELEVFLVGNARRTGGEQTNSKPVNEQTEEFEAASSRGKNSPILSRLN